MPLELTTQDAEIDVVAVDKLAVIRVDAGSMIVNVPLGEDAVNELIDLLTPFVGSTV